MKVTLFRPGYIPSISKCDFPDPIMLAHIARVSHGTDIPFITDDNEYDIVNDGYEKSIKTIENLLKRGHMTIFENISYSFYIEDVSRTVLQEIARHRISSLNVESTRYCLKTLLNEYEEKVSKLKPRNIHDMAPKYDIVDLFIIENFYITADNDIPMIKQILDSMVLRVKDGEPIDRIKYMLPECKFTKLVWTMNIREFISVCNLRISKYAHPEFRELVTKMFLELYDKVDTPFWDILTSEDLGILNKDTIANIDAEIALEEARNGFNEII